MNRLTKLLLLFILPLLFACTQKEQEVQEVRVESVTLSQSSAELEIGKTLQLNVTVSPSTATRKDITWSSTKSSVASVSSSGLVTAVSEGTTTITATADGKKGECTVTVFKGFVAVSEVKLGKTEVTLFEGEEETLTASVLPDNATDKTITWTSSDKSIASVESGKVKAVKKGEATITAKAGDKTAEAKIVVLASVSGITLNKNRLDMIIGETETLTATITPADADPKEPITWTTSDETIATVDDGKVTAVKEGEATITASSDGKSATCIVKVDYIHVS
ncbi:MAG: Ig-like domain-containing protein, partial [Bacteroidales bacterium]|nr:Ig-like domain-containing protein [Bacteroidales bacterium]